MRCELSTREASIIATAVLIDVGLVSSSKTTLIVDKSKIEREIKKIGAELESRQHEHLKHNKTECLFFDGREDKSLSVEKDNDGVYSSHYTIENHYTLTNPVNYVDSFT